MLLLTYKVGDKCMACHLCNPPTFLQLSSTTLDQFFLGAFYAVRLVKGCAPYGMTVVIPYGAQPYSHPGPVTSTDTCVSYVVAGTSQILSVVNNDFFFHILSLLTLSLAGTHHPQHALHACDRLRHALS